MSDSILPMLATLSIPIKVNFADKLVGQAYSDDDHNTGQLYFDESGHRMTGGSNAKDIFDGGDGIDFVLFSGEYSQYDIDIANGIVSDSVSDRDNVDTLINIERLQFSDTVVAYDTGYGEHAGAAYRLYDLFDRSPDTEGLGYWINALDAGASLETVASFFLTALEYQNLYGSNLSDSEFVRMLYSSVLGRVPDEGGFRFWVDALSSNSLAASMPINVPEHHTDNNSGATFELLARSAVLISFTESQENLVQTGPLTSNGIQYDSVTGLWW